MQKNGNYTDDELKAIQSDFTKLIPDMAQKLNNLKGYEVAYSAPTKGAFIMEHDGKLYLVDLTPIECMGSNTLDNACKEYKHCIMDK